MRGFDKLEEGRSRVLVYQVGSIQIIYQDVIRWLYQVDCQMDPYQILVDVSRVYWIQLDPVGSQVDPCVSQVDPCVSQWILVGSMCILGGSMYILVDLSWIHVYPVGSLYILVEPLQTLVYPLLDPCRSLQIFSISTCIFIYPLYPYQSTLSLSIHSYPLLSTLSIYSISFNIHSMQQIYFAFFIKALLNMRIFRIFPLFTSRKLLQPIKSIQNTSIPLIDIIPINWNSFQSSCTCHHVHPSFFSKSLLINVDDSIQYNNQLLFFLFIV